MCTTVRLSAYYWWYVYHRLGTAGLLDKLGRPLMSISRKILSCEYTSTFASLALIQNTMQKIVFFNDFSWLRIRPFFNIKLSAALIGLYGEGEQWWFFLPVYPKSFILMIWSSDKFLAFQSKMLLNLLLNNRRKRAPVTSYFCCSFCSLLNQRPWGFLSAIHSQGAPSISP